MIRLGEIQELIIGAHVEGHPFCDLFHEPEFESLSPVVIYSVPFGYHGQHSDDLILAICERCYSRLQDDEWMLIYCYECNNSRWIYKPDSKLNYRKDTKIIWTRGCHECPDFDGKPKAAYFTNQVQEKSDG